EKDPSDVLVIKLGGSPSLLVKAANIFQIGGHFGGQNLERHRAVELCVPCPDDGSHAAYADRLEQFVMCQQPAAEHIDKRILQAHGSLSAPRNDGRGVV